MQIRNIYRFVLVAVLVSLPALSVQSQDKYPLNVIHTSCNGLFKSPSEITEDNVYDFVSAKNITVKLFSCESTIKPGSAYDDMSAIIMDKQEFLKLSADQSLLLKYKQHINSTIGKLDDNISKHRNQLLITTLRDKKEIITYVHFLDDRIVAYAHVLDPKDETFTALVTNALSEEIKYAKDKNQDIIWMGDEIGLPIDRKLNEEKSYCFRRMNSINKKIPVTEGIMDKEFTPGTSTVCNAIPSTPRQLMKGGLPTNRLKEWVNFKNEVNAAAKGHFAKQINTLAELKEEMLSGTSDFVMVVAHLKGTDLFIGNESISLAQFKALGKREKPTGGHRTAILSICNAGNQQYKVGSLFWKMKVEPLSNILLNNGYFDMVIAPDHTIYRNEVVEVVNGLLKKQPLFEIQARFKGWGPLVNLKFKKIKTAYYDY